MAYTLLSVVSFPLTLILFIFEHVLKKKKLFRVEKDNLWVLWFFILCIIVLKMIDNILQHPKEAIFENFKQPAFVSYPQAGFRNLSTVDILMR